MYVTKKILHILYVVDVVSVLLVLGLFVYQQMFSGPIEYSVESEYMECVAFMSTLKVLLIYNVCICGFLTVLFKWLRKEISDEFKCMDNRVMELEKLENDK